MDTFTLWAGEEVESGFRRMKLPTGEFQHSHTHRRVQPAIAKQEAMAPLVQAVDAKGQACSIEHRLKLHQITKWCFGVPNLVDR